MGFLSGWKRIKNEFAEANDILKMSGERLLELDDMALRELIEKRIEAEVRRRSNDWIYAHLNKSKCVFYTIDYYEMEVNNGGLCQYFVNSSRETAPYLIGSLEEIGAIKNIKLLQKFLQDNDISLIDLDTFICYHVDEFEEKEKMYPFEDFDDAFYDLYETESLSELLLQYVRKNIEEFQYRINR